VASPTRRLAELARVALGPLAALIQGFGGAETIAFAAEFAFGGGGAGALFAGTGLGFRQFLAAAGEADFADGDAGATGAFGATLATVGLALVGVAFARPLVLLHSATGTLRRRNRFPNTSALPFLCFHKGYRAGSKNCLSDIISSFPISADVSIQSKSAGVAKAFDAVGPV